ncbi:MAG: ribonuclease J [Vallitaleaceae bacterium]|nr:ribonuclease J [Vallitaleaceae bacterium]
MKKTNEKLKIIPLGGLDKIGMNITVFQYKDDIVVVDCGIAFPEDEMLGIDLVIPDATYLKNNLSKVRGFVHTHGHEDHIGALPYILKDVNVPVYGTRLTIGLIENKLKEHRMLADVDLRKVAPGQKIKLGHFNIEFIRTNHSIADALALAITCPAGVVVHTGDFKVDYNPIYGKPIDLAKFAELGKRGVLALMADSTNAERKGYTMSESSVGKSFDQIFEEYKGRRIIVATFASNVDRVQQIVNSAKHHRRKIIVQGRSMENVVATAHELGYLKMPKSMFADIGEIDKYKDGQVVLITTGSQGEPMAALSRMASGNHKYIQIQEGDIVILSSKPIPGNEKYVSKVMNDLYRRGAEVIYEDTHVSGHACQEELKLLHTLVRPKFFIPVHGEYRHLRTHARLAESLGMNKNNIFLMNNGEILELDNEGAERKGLVPCQPVLVDGLGVGDVGNVVLRDRQILSKDGLIIVTLTVRKGSMDILAGPEIVSRGFVYIRDSSDLMQEARNVVLKTIENSKRKNDSWNKMKNAVKDDLREHLWKQMKRNPMILPIIMEVE